MNKNNPVNLRGLRGGLRGLSEQNWRKKNMTKAATSVARKRIAGLLDEGSFLEIGGLVTARSTDFNMDAASEPTDGVVTGYGDGCFHPDDPVTAAAWRMCTARTRRCSAVRSERCTRQRSAGFMSWR